jgi:hypothetical protein
VSNFRKDFYHVFGKVTSSKVNSHHSVGKGVSFVNWDRVGNTITGVNNDTSCSSRGIKGENGLNSNIELGDLEVVKHD